MALQSPHADGDKPSHRWWWIMLVYWRPYSAIVSMAGMSGRGGWLVIKNPWNNQQSRKPVRKMNSFFDAILSSFLMPSWPKASVLRLNLQRNACGWDRSPHKHYKRQRCALQANQSFNRHSALLGTWLIINHYFLNEYIDTLRWICH